MVDQIQSAMGSVEQYRMAMDLIKMWEAHKMTALYVFGALLLLTIALYVIKSCWKNTLLFLTLLIGLTILGFEGFKKYIDYKKQEVKTDIISTVTEVIESATTIPVSNASDMVKDVMGLVK